MATAAAAMKIIRKLCLSLPDTDEAEHFGRASFRVRGKIFATCGEQKGICPIVVQLQPAHAAEILESDSRFQAYPRLKNCVWIDAASVKKWEPIKELVLESYQLIASSAKPKKPTTRTRPKQTKKK